MIGKCAEVQSTCLTHSLTSSLLSPRGRAGGTSFPFALDLALVFLGYPKKRHPVVVHFGQPWVPWDCFPSLQTCTLHCCNLCDLLPHSRPFMPLPESQFTYVSIGLSKGKEPCPGGTLLSEQSEVAGNVWGGHACRQGKNCVCLFHFILLFLEKKMYSGPTK